MNDQRKIWDLLANEKFPLRSVISKNDLNNYCIDNLQKRFFNDIVKIKREFKVLDVGCGVGRWSLWVAPNVDKVVGVDLSPNMIDISKKRADSCISKNVEFFVIENSLKKFKDDEFDLVIGIWLLKYITEDDKLRKMIEDMCRVTKVGGHIILIEQVGNNVILSKEDLSGRSFLRHPDYYMHLFKCCNMEIIKHYILNHIFIGAFFYSLIRKKVKIQRYSNIDQFFLNRIMEIDYYFNILIRNHNLIKMRKKIDGHHLFYFRKLI